jgi:putative ABC transport system substrate-binding protein
MNRKSFSCVLFAALWTSATYAPAQQAKVHRIGYLSGRDASSPGPLLEAFQKGLREFGYIEGKNIIVEYRFLAGRVEEFQRFVRELVDLKVDVLVVPIQVSIAKQIAKTTPIVMITSGDPVADGVVDSLARPGGNITGFTSLSRELTNKRLGLLKEVVPRLARVGILRHLDSSTGLLDLKELEAETLTLKLQFQRLEVRGTNPDIEGAFKSAVDGRAGAILTATPLLINQQKRIADLAIRHRLPSMFEGGTWVDAGGLMSYSSDEPDLFHRAAGYVDRILKGTKPADLPVQQPMKFEFVVNLKTAKQIGLAIPQTVLFRADRVIK